MVTDKPTVGDCERSDGTPPDADDVFSARELAYIAARAAGKTIKASARAAKPPIPYSSARRFDDRVDVRASVRKLAREAIEDGVRGLAASASTAARTLRRVAVRGSGGEAVSAAKAILEISHKALELEDIQEQLDEVKTAIANINQNNPSLRRF